MTLGAKAERHSPAAAITEPGDDDVDHADTDETDDDTDAKPFEYDDETAADEE